MKKIKGGGGGRVEEGAIGKYVSQLVLSVIQNIRDFIIENK